MAAFSSVAVSISVNQSRLDFRPIVIYSKLQKAPE